MNREYQHTANELERTRKALREAERSSRELHDAVRELEVEKHKAVTARDDTLRQLQERETLLSQTTQALEDERDRVRELERERNASEMHALGLQRRAEELQRRVQDRETAASHYQREAAALQEAIGDPARYVPACELLRVQEEVRLDHQVSIVQPVQQLLQALTLSSDAAQTRLVLARSRVMEAARVLEDRLAHSDATIVALKEYLVTYQQPLEAQTTAVLTRVVAENTDLYNQLRQLEQEYAVNAAKLEQSLPRSACVSLAQHEEELEEQAAAFTGRLMKAQDLLKAQTTLIRQHEEAIEEMMDHKRGLEAQLATATQALQRSEEERTLEAAALEEQRLSTTQLASELAATQDALATERRRLEEESVPRAELSRVEEQVREQATLITSLQSQLQSSEQFVTEAMETTERLQQELTRQQETHAAYEKQWLKETAGMRKAQSQAVRALEARFEEQVALLEGELQEVRASQQEEAAQRQEEAHRAAELERSHESVGSRLAAALAQAELYQRQAEEVLPATAAERDALRTSLEVTESKKADLERHVVDVEKRHAALASSLEKERESWATQRLQLIANWEAAEAARASLQEELAGARSRIGALELEMEGDRVRGEDRATLLAENKRLQAALASQTTEAASWHTAQEKDRVQSRLHEELSCQVAELQKELAGLPAMRKAVRELEAGLRASREEIQGLLKERDALAARVHTLVQRRAEASKLDDELEKVLQEATEATTRRRKSSMEKADNTSNKIKTRTPVHVSPGGGGSAPSSYQDLSVPSRTAAALRSSSSSSVSAAVASSPPPPRTHPLSSLKADENYANAGVDGGSSKSGQTPPASSASPAPARRAARGEEEEELPGTGNHAPADAAMAGQLPLSRRQWKA